jgi:hypothetical protein
VSGASVVSAYEALIVPVCDFSRCAIASPAAGGPEV